MKIKKLGLALGAGGARGFAHIGFLKVLEENNIPVSFVSGTSLGAAIGAIYCAGNKPEQMIERAKVLKFRDILDIEVFFFKKSGFIKGLKAENILKNYLGGKSFSDCVIPFSCLTVDIMTGKEVILSEGSLLKSVMASCAIPSVFAPVEIDGKKYVDGGVLNRLPIDAVRKMGAEIVVAVDVLGDTITEIVPKNIISTLVRIINIMDWQITKGSLSKADYVAMVDQKDVDQFVVKNLDKSIEAGRVAAEKALPDIKKLMGIE